MEFEVGHRMGDKITRITWICEEKVMLKKCITVRDDQTGKIVI